MDNSRGSTERNAGGSPSPGQDVPGGFQDLVSALATPPTVEDGLRMEAGRATHQSRPDDVQVQYLTRYEIWIMDTGAQARVWGGGDP